MLVFKSAILFCAFYSLFSISVFFFFNLLVAEHFIWTLFRVIFWFIYVLNISLYKAFLVVLAIILTQFITVCCCCYFTVCFNHQTYFKLKFYTYFINSGRKWRLVLFYPCFLFLPLWCSKIPPFIISFQFREFSLATLLE